MADIENINPDISKDIQGLVDDIVAKENSYNKAKEIQKTKDKFFHNDSLILRGIADELQSNIRKAEYDYEEVLRQLKINRTDEIYEKVKSHFVELSIFDFIEVFRFIGKREILDTVRNLWYVAETNPKINVDYIKNIVKRNIFVSQMTSPVFFKDDNDQGLSDRRMVWLLRDYMWYLCVNQKWDGKSDYVEITPDYNFSNTTKWIDAKNDEYYADLFKKDKDIQLKLSNIHMGDWIDIITNSNIFFKTRFEIQYEQIINWSNRDFENFADTIRKSGINLNNILTNKELFDYTYTKKYIIKIDPKTNATVAVYNTRTQCLEDNDIKKNALSMVLSGQRKTLKGFIYKEDTISCNITFEDWLKSNPKYPDEETAKYIKIVMAQRQGKPIVNEEPIFLSYESDVLKKKIRKLIIRYENDKYISDKTKEYISIMLGIIGDFMKKYNIKIEAKLQAKMTNIINFYK